MLSLGVSLTALVARGTAAVSVGALDPTITPPILTLAVGPTTYPPQFDAAIDGTVAVGDALELQWDDDVRFGSPTATVSNTIDSGEAGAGAATFAGLSSIAAGTNYFRARVVQADNDYSAWSNTVLHGAVADTTPAAFAFTDVTNAALSTTQESNTVTLTGFNQPVPISVTGGEYAINTGSGFGAWTAAAGTAYPGDQVKVRHTSSGANSTATNTVLTVGGVSDTFTSTTLAAVVTLPSSGLIGRWDADDSATLFQTITGTTAPADGQPIGTWNDKSGAGFHFTAAANDTTRPTYRAGGGLPYIEFDGTNDVLRKLAKLGMNDAAIAGGLTVAIAMRSATATSAHNGGILVERASSSSNTVYGMVSHNTGVATGTSAFIRNDANAALTPGHTASALDAADTVLIHTDSGSNLIAYDDGVAGSTRAVARSGAYTLLDTTALGAWFRTGSISNYLGMRVYSIAVWNRILTSGERATVNTYMAAKQGRLL